MCMDVGYVYVFPEGSVMWPFYLIVLRSSLY